MELALGSAAATVGSSNSVEPVGFKFAGCFFDSFSKKITFVLVEVRTCGWLVLKPRGLFVLSQRSSSRFALGKGCDCDNENVNTEN